MLVTQPHRSCTFKDQIINFCTVEDQTLTQNELIQRFGNDNFGALGQAVNLRFDADGNVICYRTPLCLALASLHPDRAPDNPDSVMLLATGKTSSGPLSFLLVVNIADEFTSRRFSF